MMSGLHGCSCPNHTTLKLPSIPTFSSPLFPFKNPTFSFHKSPLPRPIKALSSATVQTATPKAPQDQGQCLGFFSFTSPAELNSKKPIWSCRCETSMEGHGGLQVDKG